MEPQHPQSWGEFRLSFFQYVNDRLFMTRFSEASIASTLVVEAFRKLITSQAQELDRDPLPHNRSRKEDIG